MDFFLFGGGGELLGGGGGECSCGGGKYLTTRGIGDVHLVPLSLNDLLSVSVNFCIFFFLFFYSLFSQKVMFQLSLITHNSLLMANSNSFCYASKLSLTIGVEVNY